MEQQEDDKLVTLKEAAKELNVSILKFITIVNLNRVVALQSFAFGINIFLPHSEVLRLKKKYNFNLV